MELEKREFQSIVREGQQFLLEILAHNPDISVENFYKVAQTLEYVTLFSGFIFDLVSTKKVKQQRDFTK